MAISLAMIPLLFVGVAGGTGSGKTTFARHLIDRLPAGSATLLQLDSYYRDRSHESPEVRAQVNYDHPSALEEELLTVQLRQLAEGTTVDVPIYDFVTHTRIAACRQVVPTAIVIVEGILTLALDKVRPYLGMKLFVDADADVRVIRRIRRDTEKRGRSLASISEQYYRTVRPMHQAYVEPSKSHCDLIIPIGGENKIALDVVAARLREIVNLSSNSS